MSDLFSGVRRGVEGLGREAEVFHFFFIMTIIIIAIITIMIEVSE